MTSAEAREALRIQGIRQRWRRHEARLGPLNSSTILERLLRRG